MLPVPTQTCSMGEADGTTVVVASAEKIAMSKDDKLKQYWFRAKRYGWGWGLPATWQGWVFTLVWATVTISVVCWVGNRNLPLAFVILTVMSALLLIVVFTKGEPPRWR